MSEANYKKNSVDFTIGADPEFTCLNKKGDIVNAKTECSDSYNNKFGADGNGITFEIRPDPSNSPIQLVKNIRDIFVGKVSENPRFLKWDWLGGSFKYGYPLGGHIHFGISKDKISPVTASTILSQYLGAINLLIEETKEAKQRRKGSYGGFIDNRPQDWGFEYRTLSSWLVSPKISAANLCLAKTIMWEVLNNKNFKPGNYVDEKTFANVDTQSVANAFPKIWNDIINMQLYPKYKQYIDVLYYLVIKKLTWFPKGDMKAAWGLVDCRVLSENITLDSVWAPFHKQNITPRNIEITQMSF